MILIDGQNYLVVDEYRRCAKAVEHVERPEWESPSFLALAVVGKQTEVLEEDINVRAVRDGTRGRRAIDVLQPAGLPARCFALPQDFSGLAVETDHEQLLIVVGRDEDAIVGQHGRRVTRRQSSLPKNILIGAEGVGNARRSRDAAAVWSAKLRPVFRECFGDYKRSDYESNDRQA